MEQALRSTGRFALDRVKIRSNREGHVQLSGRVHSYYLKQLAQAAVLGVEGVETLDNELEVA